jgi:hypothetical protein
MDEKKVEVAKKVTYTLTCPDVKAAVRIAQEMVLFSSGISIQANTLTLSLLDTVDPVEAVEDKQIFTAIMRAGYSS